MPEGSVVENSVLNLLEGLNDVEKCLQVRVPLKGRVLGVKGSLPGCPLGSHRRAAIDAGHLMLALPLLGLQASNAHPDSHSGSE